MASEKAWWWCYTCERHVVSAEVFLSEKTGGYSHIHEGIEHLVWFIPGAALDAHTAEVVERCEQVLRNLADAKDIEASDLEDIAGQTTIVEKLIHDCYLLNAAANAIRALAPRKEG